jgi:hypothetical protein
MIFEMDFIFHDFWGPSSFQTCFCVLAMSESREFDLALVFLRDSSYVDQALDTLCTALLGGAHPPHEERMRVLQALSPILNDARALAAGGFERSRRLFRALVLAAQMLCFSQNRDELYASSWQAALSAAHSLLKVPLANTADAQDARFLACLTMSSYLYLHRSTDDPHRADLISTLERLPHPCPRTRALQTSLHHASSDQRSTKQMFPTLARVAMLVIIIAACSLGFTLVSQDDRFPLAFAAMLALGLLMDVAFSSTALDDKHAALSFAPALYFTPDQLNAPPASPAARRAAAIAAVPLLPIHVVRATIDDESSDEQSEQDDETDAGSETEAPASPPKHTRNAGSNTLDKFSHVALQKQTPSPNPAAKPSAALDSPSAHGSHDEFVTVKHSKKHTLTRKEKKKARRAAVLQARAAAE